MKEKCKCANLLFQCHQTGEPALLMFLSDSPVLAAQWREAKKRRPRQRRCACQYRASAHSVPGESSPGWSPWGSPGWSPSLRTLPDRSVATDICLSSSGILRCTEQYCHHPMKPGLNLISLGLRSQTGGPRKGHVDWGCSLGNHPEPPIRKDAPTEDCSASLQLATRGKNIGIFTR